MPLRDALTATAGTSYVIAPRVNEGDSRSAVENPFDSIQATIEGTSTMTRNILEHSFQEIYYPIRNNIADALHFLRHPIKTVNQDSISFIPKSIAAPFATVLSSTTWLVRSILEVPEDLSRWLWQTPIDAVTSGTIGQLWLPGRLLHYWSKVISTPPRLFFHYTTSLLWRGIDIVGDSIAKLTQYDATPEDWRRYVTPSSFTFDNIIPWEVANDNRDSMSEAA